MAREAPVLGGFRVDGFRVGGFRVGGFRVGGRGVARVRAAGKEGCCAVRACAADGPGHGGE
ncbi:hypothetical protein ACGFYZ_31410 [Streptomyces sp. NPDC048330]|uniref:hypothetical protein n=1 Tax=Streptomyces sp. NPDC048330 TaxID=3365533 RepID=UPI0037188046